MAGMQQLPSRVREGLGEGLSFQASSPATCPPLAPPANGRGI
jgi:hypothetical protein